MRRLGLGLGAVLLLTLAGAGSAIAAPSKVSAVTHSNPHPDTTDTSGACTLASDGGPVWAYDNLSLKLTVTPETAPGNYSVTIDANGSFSAFADPTTGDCWTQNGSVDGTLQWDVLSLTAPNPKSLPSQVSGDLSQSQIVNLLFDGNSTIVGGGHYRYTYNRVAGGKYVQQG